MDIRKLEVFAKLMETRSFSRSARELFLSQPTISGHIKSLETETGMRLFDRQGREVLPTPAAEVLLEYATRILDLRQEALYALERFNGQVGGVLKMGGSTIPCGYILPEVAGSFRARYSQACLTLVQGDTREIVGQVREGQLELGMVGAVHEHENLEYTPLLEDELILIAPAGHPAAARGRLENPAGLAELPFIMREDGSGTRTSMLKSLARHGIGIEDLNVVAVMGSTESVRRAVSSGLGVSFISSLAVRGELECSRIKPLAAPFFSLKRMFYLVVRRHRTRSPLCQRFIEYLKTYELENCL